MARWTESALSACVRDVTARYADAGYFPSAVVRVFDREKTLCAVAVGDARVDSVFDVASLTKIATATQILLYIDAGALSLSAPIADCFPEIAGDEYLCERFRGVTVYRLLTHTSSLVDWYPFYTRRGEDFFSVLKFALQNTERTVGVVYSDLNFMLLGKLLERLSGLPLAECLQEKLVRPLALSRVTYRPDRAWDVVPTGVGDPTEKGMVAARGLAFPGFRPDNETVRFDTHDCNAHYFFDDVAGHAGVFATAEGYERLCRFYMNTASPLLIAAQREQEPGRGLGWQTGVMYPYGCGHTGFTGTSVYLSREKNLGVAAFTNRLYYPELNPRATGDFRRALHEAVLAVYSV